MSVSTLKAILMQRDECSAEEAMDMIREARARVEAGEDPEEVLLEELGLEPDYLFDIL